MKQPVDTRKPDGIVDYLALGLTTFGVGYIPGAPGTYGSAIAVAIYLATGSSITASGFSPASYQAIISLSLLVFCLTGIWASDRATSLLGNEDPNAVVVDELMGQFVTFCFVPFGIGWPFILAGFLLFRLFDIWKPYPIDDLQGLPGGIGICADDIVAGVYAGICLSIVYAFTLWI